MFDTRDRRSILTAETVGQTGPPFDTDRRDRRATGAAGYWDHSEEGLRMTEVTGDQTLLGRGNEQGAGALRATARRIAKRSLRATTAVAHTAAMAAVGKIYVEELMDRKTLLRDSTPSWRSDNRRGNTLELSNPFAGSCGGVFLFLLQRRRSE